MRDPERTSDQQATHRAADRPDTTAADDLPERPALTDDASEVKGGGAIAAAIFAASSDDELQRDPLKVTLTDNL